MFQPARPSDSWSSVANCLATSKGSLNVVLIVPVNPSRSVTAAKRRQHGERVRPAHHVEVVDLAAMLAQSQPLSEEEEVEQAAFGGAGHVRERLEFDLAARLRIRPHCRVVDAREMGG